MTKSKSKRLKGNSSKKFKKACLWGAIGVLGAYNLLAGYMFISSNPALDNRYCDLPNHSTVTLQADKIGANKSLMQNRLFIKRGQDCQIVVQKDIPQFVANLLKQNVDLINKVFDTVNDEYNFVVKREGEDNASMNSATITVTVKDIEVVADVTPDKSIKNVIASGLYKANTKANMRLDVDQFVELYGKYFEDGAYNPHMQASASRVILHELMHCLGLSDYESKPTAYGYDVQCFYDKDNQKHFVYDTNGNLTYASFNKDNVCISNNVIDQYGNSLHGVVREPSIMEYDIVFQNTTESKLYQMDVKFLLSNYNNEIDHLHSKLDKLINDKYLVSNCDKSKEELSR